MSNIETHIETWKNKLLDLGKRNRLIFYKDTKRSSLKIISPDIDTLFSRLVVKEESLRFPSPIEPINEIENEENDLRNAQNLKNELRINKGDLQTDITVTEQQKTLRVLRTRSKTAKEEQGVNILYLSFGFLQWKERQDSDQIIKSPLVLVPVNLTVDSITSPFELSLHEDEITLNPTLIYKLENDFGVKLPEFDSDTETIDSYLSEISVMAINNGWELIYETGLSLFSFLKINMYKDLEKNKARIGSHEIITAIVGDNYKITEIPKELDDWDHDEKDKPLETFDVLNADPSQLDAILYSRKGISFILQGPPGTGKSQTITNIISEALADGKKVLFVSEKMAALEVVHKRLNETGLSDFCLTLHSHKANKKEVLAELGRTLSLPKFRMKDEAYDQLESLKLERDKLNQYDKQLHTVIPPLNRSIFDINGKLTKLSIENTPSIIFSIPNIRKTTTDQVFNYLYLIKELSRTLEKMNDDYYGNVWWGCKLKNITHEQRNNIDTNLSNLSQNLNDLAHLFDEIINELGMESNSSIDLVDQAIRTLEIAQNSPRIPLSWIYKDDILPLMELANQYYDLVKEYRNINIELHNKVRDGFFQLPAQEASDSLTKSITNVHSGLNKDTYQNREDVINLLPSLINQVGKWIKNFDSILTISETSINLIGTKKVKTLFDAKALSKLYDDLLLNPKIPQEWFNKDKFTATKRIFNEARIKYQEIDLETSRILQRFDKEILDIDHSAILIRFKAEYTSILKYFNGSYYSDCKSIKTLCKSNEKFSDHNLISLLIELKNLSEKRAWLKENENLLFNLLGNNYLREYTDWNSLNSLINTFQRITTYFEVNDVSPQIKKILTADYFDLYTLLKSNSEEIKFIQNDLFLNDISVNISISQNASEVDVVEVHTKLLHLLNDLHVLEKIYRQINNFVIHEVSIEVILNYLDNLGKLQTINQLVETNTNVLKEKYNFLFKGIETDWNIIIQALIWTKEFRTLRDKHPFTDTFIENICGDATKIKYSRYACETLKQKLSNIQTEWEWFLNLFDDIDRFINMDLHKLLERINLCKHDMSALEDWIDYRNCIEKCHDNGLSQYVEAIENNKIRSRELVSVFEKRFYRLWLDAVTPEFPAVQNFRSEIHEDTIRSFATLDSTQLNIAQKRVKERLVSRLPDIDRLTAAKDEVSILRRELSKQRKIMPLRKLFQQIPNLLLTLKPCFMMSPLSVSLFLEEYFFDFDIIIFDEASQVRTEDAIGSLLRGKQVVIAGDNKQLPPTNFFSASISSDDFDFDSEDSEDYADTDSYESILDQASSILPKRTLRWHYRSRHESLIAFSNAKIYNNDLFTFPNSITEEEDLGVEYIFVSDGVYDRSGRRNNIVEAKRVAEIVIEQIQKHPNRSSGVVTFSEAQQLTVEEAIRRLRIENPQFESYFNEENEEPFFVKNLENVQGDERDTIIFSIGYAKDPRGVMHMNFGPLGKSGGYRRLNVAITRAKYNVKLVGSIQPTDIILENTNSEGVKLLRSYIEYAKIGPSYLDNELKHNQALVFESPFEEAVYDFIRENGYQLETQVGCSGYRIDMAIKHPTLNGRFTLGIECDGASYHNSRTARERDSLRQIQLEDIGWRIYRIWSTDWVKDPIKEGKKLLDAVEDSIQNYSESDLGSKKKDKSRDIKLKNTDSLIEKQQPQVTPSTNEFEKYGFVYYEEAKHWYVQRKNGESDELYLANVIRFVLQKEYPIHADLLNQRLAPLFGRQKATIVIRNSVLVVVSMVLSEEIENRNGFYWPKNERKLRVRVPKGQDGFRQVGYICTEEIAKAMFEIVKDSYGIMQKDLFIATGRIFGFNRIGNNITQNMEIALQYLLKFKLVSIFEGKVIENQRK